MSKAAGRPVPTRRFVIWFAIGLLPAVASLLLPGAGWWVLAIDATVVVLAGLDFAFAPRVEELTVERRVEPILSSGAWSPVRLVLDLRGPRAIRGEVRDAVPQGIEVVGHRQPFELHGLLTLSYRVRPPFRGDLPFGDLFFRLPGPLGLCARQQRVPLAATVKVYPDLSALTKDALLLALASEAPAERLLRKPAEGSEFESLREYRAGDDYRTLDWKATARKAKPMVRQYEPERNQPVLLLLDCGRHMAGKIHGRRKLDFAVDAALRLAKVSLDKGDVVGVIAFASRVQAHLPPRKGPEHLRAITSALYRVEASLEESDYGQAFDLAFARHHRRTLVALFTDVMDPDTSATLLARTLALRPRHLPLVISLLDEDLAEAAVAVPTTPQRAYERQVAARLEAEHRLTTTRLRDAGALALRAPASTLSAAAVNEYIRVKARGLL